MVYITELLMNLNALKLQLSKPYLDDHAITLCCCIFAQNADNVAVNSAYDDILAMSAIRHDPAVSQLPVPLGSSTEGYEMIHSAPLSLTVRDEVSLYNYATKHGHTQFFSTQLYDVTKMYWAYAWYST